MYNKVFSHTILKTQLFFRTDLKINKLFEEILFKNLKIFREIKFQMSGDDREGILIQSRLFDLQGCYFISCEVSMRNYIGHIYVF